MSQQQMEYLLLRYAVDGCSLIYMLKGTITHIHMSMYTFKSRWGGGKP